MGILATSDRWKGGNAEDRRHSQNAPEDLNVCRETARGGGTVYPVQSIFDGQIERRISIRNGVLCMTLDYRGRVDYSLPASTRLT